MKTSVCSLKTGFALFALLVVGMVLLDHLRGFDAAGRLKAAAAEASASQTSTVKTSQAETSTPEATPTPAPQPENPKSAAVPALDEAIRRSADAFVAAFNRGDAAAVAALWAADGELIDQSGRRFQGREQIEHEYAAFFQNHSDEKIDLKIESIRPIGADTAVEDGQAWLVGPGGAKSPASPYTVIHTKTDGRWLMASVREPVATRVGQAAADTSPLESLDWLVGRWHAEKDGAQMEVRFRWIADDAFLERTFSVVRDGEVTISGVQLIGQDAGHREIQSWDFASDAGYAVGNWISEKDGWSIVTRGKTGDGKPTSAVNYLVRVDENTLTWQSRERKADGQDLPDTDVVWLVRESDGR